MALFVPDIQVNYPTAQLRFLASWLYHDDTVQMRTKHLSMVARVIYELYSALGSVCARVHFICFTRIDPN